MGSVANEEQARPHGDKGVDIVALVIQDMEARGQVGEARYGERLHPFNGRNALVDAYQEALDLAIYLRQAIYEGEQAEEVIGAKPRHELDKDEYGNFCRVCGMRADKTERFPQPYCDGVDPARLGTTIECKDCV